MPDAEPQAATKRGKDKKTQTTNTNTNNNKSTRISALSGVGHIQKKDRPNHFERSPQQNY